MLTDDSFNSLAHEFIAQSNLFCRGQKLMNVMPPFIAYGYACGVHMPLVMGLHVVIIPNLDPRQAGRTDLEAQARAHVRRSGPLPADGSFSAAQEEEGSLLHPQLCRRRRLRCRWALS